MATKTIAHALFTWREDGRLRTARHGQTIEIPDDVVEHYTRFGVFTDDEVAILDDLEPPATGPDVSSTDTSSPPLPDKPAAIATKEQWITYAAALHEATAGARGFPYEVATAYTRTDLTKALIAQEATHE